MMTLQLVEEAGKNQKIFALHAQEQMGSYQLSLV